MLENRVPPDVTDWPADSHAAFGVDAVGRTKRSAHARLVPQTVRRFSAGSRVGSGAFVAVFNFRERSPFVNTEPRGPLSLRRDEGQAYWSVVTDDAHSVAAAVRAMWPAAPEPSPGLRAQGARRQAHQPRPGHGLRDRQAHLVPALSARTHERPAPVPSPARLVQPSDYWLATTISYEAGSVCLAIHACVLATALSAVSSAGPS
jgi:hypothetical protein